MTASQKERLRKEREARPIQELLQEWTTDWIKLELDSDENWDPGTVPISWEPAVVQATLKTDASKDLLEHCAILLVAMESQHPRLPQLLTQIMQNRPGILDFELTYNYAREQNWALPTDLRQAIKAAIRQMPEWRRAILLLDGHVRTLLKISKTSSKD